MHSPLRRSRRLRKRRHQRQVEALQLDDELIEAIVRALSDAVDEHTRSLEGQWRRRLVGARLQQPMSLFSVTTTPDVVDHAVPPTA